MKYVLFSFRGLSRVVVCSSLIFTTGQATAAEPATKSGNGTLVTYRAATDSSPTFKLSENNELILSAPPRENISEAEQVYTPVAEYLSKVLGRTVMYKYPGNWGVYQGLMQKGAYDIVFDGPHFNSWRVERTQHNVLVKVPGDHVFVVLVKKDNERLRELKQLVGRTLCAHAPPNLGTLTVLNEFDNPARQPLIVNIEGWKNIYDGMIANKCVAAVVTLKALEQLEKDSGRQTKMIFRGPTLPDNAFSAGPRITTADQEKIARALMTPEGEKATAKLREKYAGNKAFIASNNKEYNGLSIYLKNEWGY